MRRRNFLASITGILCFPVSNVLPMDIYPRRVVGVDPAKGGDSSVMLVIDEASGIDDALYRFDITLYRLDVGIWASKPDDNHERFTPRIRSFYRKK